MITTAATVAATPESCPKPSRAHTTGTAATRRPPKPSRSRPAGPRCGPRPPEAACGPCVVRAGSRALALRVHQGRGLSRLAAHLPFPGSRGFADKLITTRSRPESSYTAGRFREQEARSRHPGEPASEASVGSRPGASAGRCGDASAPLEPPRANARSNERQGGTERGRSLDEARRRKHRRPNEVRPRSAASRASRAGGGFQQDSVVWGRVVTGRTGEGFQLRFVVTVGPDNR